MTEDNHGASSQRRQRVTLRTIAEATGLSLSTVSLALRGGSTLKQDTRDKVTETARQLGYVPDRAGVRLRTGKTNVIALVMDGTEDSVDFARQMIQGIGQALKGTAYHLTVTPEFDRQQSTDTIRHILHNRNADGVIITHTGRQDRRVQQMIEAGFPFVSHGRTAFQARHPYYDLHAENFAALAVARLAEKGCRRVALIIGDNTTMNYHNIVGSFRDSTVRLGLVGEVLEGVHTPADLRQLGLGFAQAAPDARPDGIICDSEMRTIALIGGLQDGGLPPGRGIELIYKQTSGILPALSPHLDAIGEDVLGAGEALTRLLLRRIEGAPATELQVLAEPVPNWV